MHPRGRGALSQSGTCIHSLAELPPRPRGHLAALCPPAPLRTTMAPGGHHLAAGSGPPAGSPTPLGCTDWPTQGSCDHSEPHCMQPTGSTQSLVSQGLGCRDTVTKRDPLSSLRAGVGLVAKPGGPPSGGSSSGGLEATLPADSIETWQVSLPLLTPPALAEGALEGLGLPESAPPSPASPYRPQARAATRAGVGHSDHRAPPLPGPKEDARSLDSAEHTLLGGGGVSVSGPEG